jgi:uncharacterized protein involved in response to NO
LSPAAAPIWALGFRPFYLLASAFAALSMALWTLEATGHLPHGYLADPLRHGHEMLYGFTLAVIAGFLLTAVRAWTGQATASGYALMALAALWVAGRVLVLTPYALAAAIVDAAFPIALAVAIALPLARSGNRRNFFFVAVLVAAGLADLALHLAARGTVDWPPRATLQVGLDLVLFIMAVISGRVVPMFTNNAIPGAGAARNAGVEKFALGALLALLACDVAGAPASLTGGVALLAALAHGVRLCLWRPWRTLGTPLVWVLHAAYAWIVIHLALRTAAAFGGIAPALEVHALTAGAIGAMTLGMMTRTARGHTGRALAADRVDVASYALVLVAALLRVFGVMLFPAAYVGMILASGACWSAAFALYAIRYAPILTRGRIDGKPG